VAPVLTFLGVGVGWVFFRASGFEAARRTLIGHVRNQRVRRAWLLRGPTTRPFGNGLKSAR
jgi:hypothetical protein